LLAAIVFACFWPALRNGFTVYDDPEYVTENPHLRHRAHATERGVGLHGGAFQQLASVDLDFARARLQHLPGSRRGPSFTSLLYPRALIRCCCFCGSAEPPALPDVAPDSRGARVRTSGCRPSRLAPRLAAAARSSRSRSDCIRCHVESVAWVSERKDVLSTFFDCFRCSRVHWVREAASRRAIHVVVAAFFAASLPLQANAGHASVVMLLSDRMAARPEGSVGRV